MHPVDIHRDGFVRGDASSTVANADPPPRAREVPGNVVESFAFDLKLADVNGMGWPMAMHLAERGKGVVEADGQRWDPATDQEISG